VSRDWLLFLDDLIEAAAKVAGFVEKRDFEAFGRDEGIFDAVLMNLLDESTHHREAVKRLPPEAIAAMPGIDWSGAAGLRDIIAHRYFAIDPELVWDIARNHVPPASAAALALRSRIDSGAGS
jgi:uncharacterized protein with HEPN domain